MLNITKLIESFTGLFGKILGVIKYFDLDTFEFNTYSQIKLLSICFHFNIPGLSNFLKDALAL